MGVRLLLGAPYYMKIKGFTLIELLVVVAIIGVLVMLGVYAMQRARDHAYMAAAKDELKSISQSLQLYMNDFGYYPPDTSRNIPPGLETYLAPGLWPDAPWPGSVFDWDNWIDPATSQHIYQISIRFCPIGKPEECRFPRDAWAKDFDIYSSVYYCIEGPCRAHIDRPIDHPGYCVNCPP